MKKVFLSYSHKDESLKEDLDTHLAALKNSEKIAIWNDRQILPGAEWNEDIIEQIESADIILLLISANFIASKYIWEKEIAIAMRRHKEKSARVIPIFLKPCDLGPDTEFMKLQGLPKDAKPITSFPNQDEALFQVAKGIRAVVEAGQSNPPAAQPPQADPSPTPPASGTPGGDDLRNLLDAKLADQPGNHLLIMLSGRLHDVERQMALGILDSGDYQRERNRIRAALLQA